MTLIRKKTIRKSFVSLFLLQLLLCTGIFSNKVLCFETSGSFHLEVSPCGDNDAAHDEAGKALPQRTPEYSGGSTSDPCASCEESPIFVCPEECENIAQQNAKSATRDLLPSIPPLTSVLFRYIFVVQPFFIQELTMVANSSIDSIRTVVLLN